jgi:hypothetical protein
MNLRIELGETPEKRIAAAVLRCLRHYVNHEGRQPDYADLEAELKPVVQHEVLLAKFLALSLPPEQREAERRRVILDLGNTLPLFPPKP